MSILTDEHRGLVDVVRRFCAEIAPSADVRAAAATERGWDPATWERAVGELGLPGLAIPEEYGGAGYGQFEQALVMEELGRRLVPSPYFGSVVLAANALLLADDEAAAKEHLPGIIEGIPSTVAHRVAPDAVIDSATGRDDARLTGTWEHVVDAPGAAQFLVVAHEAGGASLFLVDRDAVQVGVEPLETLDLTRRQGRLVLSQAPARRVGAPGGFAPALEQLLDRVRVASAAEDLGSAQECLDMSTEYATTRVQFGRAIGSFQAIKHLCADMLIAVETARSALWHAARQGPDGLHLAAPMARALTSEAARRCARGNIQVHGGIGCTWEHDAHLYYRRVESSALLHGDIASEQLVLADRLGI